MAGKVGDFQQCSGESMLVNGVSKNTVIAYTSKKSECRSWQRQKSWDLFNSRKTILGSPNVRWWGLGVVLHHSPNQNERYLKVPCNHSQFRRGLGSWGMDTIPSNASKKNQVEFHGHLHFLALATFHEARRCFYLRADEDDVGQQKILFHDFLRWFKVDFMRYCNLWILWWKIKVPDQFLHFAVLFNLRCSDIFASW